MERNYKVLEFNFKKYELDSQLILKENGKYSSLLEKEGTFTLESMLFNTPSVKSKHYTIGKIQKDDGEILEIGSNVFNDTSNDRFVIKSFVLVNENIYIHSDAEIVDFKIDNIHLQNFKKADNPQQEINFNENMYPIETIKAVLLNALDEPEVNQILDDLKNYNNTGNTIVPQVIKSAPKTFVLPEKWYIDSEEFYNVDEIKQVLMDFSGENKNKIHYAFSDRIAYYLFDDRKCIGAYNEINLLRNYKEYVKVDLKDLLEYIDKEQLDAQIEYDLGKAEYEQEQYDINMHEEQMRKQYINEQIKFIDHFHDTNF